MRCGRCDQPVKPGREELCWFCQHALCASCWREHGQCGHEVNGKPVSERPRCHRPHNPLDEPED